MLEQKDYISELNFEQEVSGICSYCGGKKRLLAHIFAVVYSAPMNTFMDLCAGSGVVSLNIHAKQKVLNDLNTDLTVIYKALSNADKTDKVFRRIKNTCFEHEYYMQATEYWKEHKSYKLNDFSDDEIVEAAYHSIILHRFSRIGSDTNTEAKYTSENISKYEYFKQSLINYYCKLYGAKVTNENILDILKGLCDNMDNISAYTTIYIDPPYLSGIQNSFKTNANTYSSSRVFKEADHEELLAYADKLPRDKCRIIISNYGNDTYDNLLSSNSFGIWTKVFVKELDVMCGNGKNFANKSRPKAYEYFYTNFKM